MSTNLVEGVLRKLKSMETIRAPYEATMREIAELYRPERGISFGTLSPGNTGMDRIWDSTPTHALELQAARMYSDLTNPAARWLGLGYRDMRKGRGKNTSKDFTEWAQKATDAILDILANDETNFYTARAEICLDAVMFGMPCQYIEEDDESLVLFRAIPVGEVYVAESARGIVDTVYRKYKMTLRQAEQMWPKKLSRESREKLKTSPEESIEILHAVFPRTDRDPRALGNTNLPVASVYIEVSAKNMLEEGGYNEMPFTCPRWSKGAGEVYARGPALTALADTRMLYAQARTGQYTAERLANPPLVATDDGVLGDIKAGPGGITWQRPNSEPIAKLPGDGDLNAVMVAMQRTDANLRQIFMSNRLDDTDRPNMTATEATIMQAERLRLQGAVIGRFQAEDLNPTIARVLGVLMRKNVVDPLPNGYTMRNVRAYYTNPVTLAQKQGQIQGLRGMTEVLAPLIGKEDAMGILDNFDMDKIARTAHEVFGNPQDWLNDEDEVASIREQRAKAQQGPQTLAGAQQVADIAKTASQADMTGMNGLTALTGGME